MNRRSVVCLLGLVLLPACNSATNPPAGQAPQQGDAGAPQVDLLDRPIATVDGMTIPYGEIEPVLLKGYGLNVLIIVMQRDMARRDAEGQHVVVTPADIEAEKKITLLDFRKSAHLMGQQASTRPDDEQITQDEVVQLQNQFLYQERITQDEFDILTEINAILRKIATPKVTINEDAIRARFNANYGEKAQVRYIVSSDMTQVTDVMRDLAAGKSFEEVVRARSIDPVSREQGGLLAPFSRNENVPAAFKAVTFGLKEGQVSDPVQIGQYIYVIKLEKLIPPQVAKYSDYHDIVKKDLFDESVKTAMVGERQALWEEMLKTMMVNDPVLGKQLDDIRSQQSKQLKDMGEIRKQMDEARQKNATRPSTPPANDLGLPSVNDLPTTLPLGR